MPEGRPPSKLASFFTSLPGIMTGVAALLTAVVGLLAFLQTRPEDDGGGGGDAWVTEANDRCLAASARLEGADFGTDPQGNLEIGSLYSDYQDAVEKLVEDFKQLTPSPDQASRASQIIGLWSESTDGFRDAFLAESSDFGSGGDEATAAHALLERGGGIAADLGAVACRELD